MVQKVAVRYEFKAGLCPCDDWQILSVSPAVNGYLFQIRERQDCERRDGLHLSMPKMPRYSKTLTPTAPMAIWLWKTFTFSKSYCYEAFQGDGSSVV